MADFTKTITNAIQCLGDSPSSKWGTGTPYTFTWGVSKWGESTQDLISYFDKLVDNSIGSDSSVSLFVDFNMSVSNALACISETYSEYLRTGNGYYYYFVAPATDAENRNLTSFTLSNGPTTAYTSLSVSATSWS